MIDPRARREYAVEVASVLRQAGYTALFAGGCVRDLLLGLVPDDYDVATDATPEQVMRLFRRTVPVGVSFGVVRVLGPRGAGEVEVATFRSDLAYVDGRRPEGVVFSSPELDACRRDFTINGMFLDPLTGEIIDYVGGRDDLRRGVLRAIGDPTARFSEDKLRLLRAVRFAARFGLEIEPTTRAALEAMADQVRVVAAERVAQELRKMLVHPSRARGIRLAHETGLLSVILPGLAGAALDRTLDLLARLPRDPSVTLASAALLHDLGRAGGDAAPSGRAGDAARDAEAICRDLKFSNTERERITWLVANQAALLDAGAMPRSRLKRLLASEGIDELLTLHRAIAEASGLTTTHVELCERYLRELPDGPLDPPPLLTGNDLKRIGLTPGPRFKAILERVRDEQLEGRLRDREEALRWVGAAEW